MSVPTTAIKLSGTTPPPPSGQQAIVFASDGATPQQSVSASDPTFVGDTGSGGLAGNVPAPPAGSAAAGKFLSASGTFEVPAGGGGGGGTTQYAEPITFNGEILFFGGDLLMIGASTDSSGGGSSLPTPVEQWLMNEGSGSVFHTSSTSGNNITASNITWATVSGFPGTVPVFDGTNGQGTGANQTNTNFTGTTPFSVSLWALINAFTAPSGDGGAGTFVTTLQGGNFTGWEVSINGTGSTPTNGAFTMDLGNNFNDGNAIQVVTHSPSPLGDVHNFVATYDGSQTAEGVKLYIDGVAQAVTISEDGLSGSIANTQPVVVGARATNGGGFFDGSLADIRIYDVELTSSQVSTLFTNGPA
jgi:hypothetical protein